MILRKWNYQTREYEPFETPAKTLMLYSPDMTVYLDCTNCGRQIIYGESYTSMTIHTEIGLGYPVCDDCHRIEWEQRNGAPME